MNQYENSFDTNCYEMTLELRKGLKQLNRSCKVLIKKVGRRFG